MNEYYELQPNDIIQITDEYANNKGEYWNLFSDLSEESIKYYVGKPASIAPRNRIRRLKPITPLNSSQVSNLITELREYL